MSYLHIYSIDNSLDEVEAHEEYLSGVTSVEMSFFCDNEFEIF